MSPHRPIPRLLLCLALGLLTTIALAWTLATIPIQTQRFYFHDTDSDWSGVEFYMSHSAGARRCVLAGPELTRQGLMPIPTSPRQVSDWAAAQLDVLSRAHIFPEWWGQSPSHASIPAGSLWAGAIQDARGWPMLALWCEWPISIAPPAPGATPLQSFGNIQPPRGGLDLSPGRTPRGYESDIARALPLRPIWRGLLIDSLLFAVPWLLLISLTTLITRALRTHLRHRRGLCPRCAYNLAGLPPDSPCPECGGAPPR